MNEEELRRTWLDLRDGDSEAFARLYRSTSSRLLAYARQLTADRELIADAMQEVFLAVWRGRTSLGVPNYIAAYLARALRNAILRARREWAECEEIDLDRHLSEIDGVSRAPESDGRPSERATLVRKLLPGLPAGQREVVHLRYYQGLTNGEIAEILGIRPQSVANKLQRAIAALRKSRALRA